MTNNKGGLPHEPLCVPIIVLRLMKCFAAPSKENGTLIWRLSLQIPE